MINAPKFLNVVVHQLAGADWATSGDGTATNNLRVKLGTVDNYV